MRELKKLVKKELREFGCKKELCRNDVEPLYYLSKTYCELMKISHMEEAEERKRLYKMLGYNYIDDDFEMSAEGQFYFGYNMDDSDYMSDYHMPYIHRKGYNPIRRENYAGLPERDRRMGRNEYSDRNERSYDNNRDYSREDGRYNDGRYNDNRGRYVNMPEVYSQYRQKGYDPSKKEGWKDTHGSSELDKHEIKDWLDGMENEDGSMGAKWSKEETTALAKSHGIMLGDKISEEEWNLAMNMFYSDYCKTAKKYGVDRPDYYADLAKDFLMDKDSVDAKEKLAAYYENIVKPAQEE